MDIFTTAGILSLLHTNGYLIMLVLMLIEGPIVTYIASFMSSLGIFNIYTVLGLSILGNFAADLIFFSLGRLGWGNLTERIRKNKKIKHLNEIFSYAETHPGRFIAIAKLVPPLPMPGLIMAGTTKISLKRFTLFSILICIPYSLFFLLAGFYSGIAFDTFSRYLKRGEVTIFLVSILFVVIWIITRKLSSKVVDKLEENLGDDGGN